MSIIHLLNDVETTYQLILFLKIPLAQAVLNKSSYETIAVLLDYDVDNITIDEVVSKEHANATAQEAMTDLDGMVPLHLALKNGDKNIIALLLQKEKMKHRGNRYESTIFCRDKKMRCPLHIAAETSTDVGIVRELLAMDDKNETTRALDSELCSPLRYACCRNDKCDEIVRVLLESEQRYLEVIMAEEGEIPQNWEPKDFQRSDYTYNSSFLWATKNAASCRDSAGKSPLFHAVKSEAHNDVIKELLRPEQLYLKGFDSLVDELAAICNDREMQDYLIDELSNRCYFCLMFFDVAFHAIALCTFIFCSERLIHSDISHAEVIVIWICICIGVLRELARLQSQRSSYFLDFCKFPPNLKLHPFC